MEVIILSSSCIHYKCKLSEYVCVEHLLHCMCFLVVVATTCEQTNAGPVQYLTVRRSRNPVDLFDDFGNSYTFFNVEESVSLQRTPESGRFRRRRRTLSRNVCKGVNVGGGSDSRNIARVKHPSALSITITTVISSILSTRKLFERHTKTLCARCSNGMLVLIRIAKVIAVVSAQLR